MALLFPDLFPQHQYGGDVAASYNALHKNALENAMKQMQGQYYGPLAESQMASAKEAMEASKFKRENPLLGTAGLPGELAAAKWFEEREGGEQQPSSTGMPSTTQRQQQPTNAPYEPPPGTDFGAANFTPPEEVNRLTQKALQSLDQPQAVNAIRQIDQAKQVANQNVLRNPTPQNIATAQNMNRASDILRAHIQQQMQQTPLAQKPGQLVQTPEGVVSTPTESSVTTLQTQKAAAERAMPMIRKLADAAAPFMGVWGMAKLGGEVAMGGKGKLATEYGKYQSLLDRAPEALLKAYGLSVTDYAQQTMRHSLQPMWGESAEQYKARMLDLINDLYEHQVKQAESNLRGGYSTQTQKPEYLQGNEASGSTPKATMRWDAATQKLVRA